MTTNTLTKAESSRYRICTEKLLECIQAQFDGGNALIEVRDRKYYRDEFDTLEDYCQQVLKISRARAYQLMEAAEVKQSLPEKAGEKIVNESQARALSSVPENLRARVIKEAEKTGNLTAESIKTSAAQMSKIVDKVHPMKPGISLKTPIELDNEGEAITKDAMPYWIRRNEVQTLMTEISRIKCILQGHAKADDRLLGWVANTAVPELAKAYQSVANALPHAVCTNCMGHPVLQKCSFCNGTGLIPKWRYETQANEEVKKIRIKAHALRAS